MGFFERYLSVWVFLCIVAGTVIGLVAPEAAQAVGQLQIAQVNLPVGILIWVMIIPMLMKIDFSALSEVYDQRAGMGVTLAVNWLIKPFTMALLAWIFLRHSALSRSENRVLPPRLTRFLKSCSPVLKQ